MASGLEMAALAVMSVGLWTLRVALAARGRKLAGSITAALEAVVFLVAFSTVMNDMEAIEKVVGYAAGVGLGALLGMWLDERLSAGQSEVRIVTRGRDLALVSSLRSQGWPVTWTNGVGPFGDVTVAFIAVDDQKLRPLLRELDEHGRDAFWTVETLKRARPTTLGGSWIQVGHGTPHLHQMKPATPRIRGRSDSKVPG